MRNLNICRARVVKTNKSKKKQYYSYTTHRHDKCLTMIRSKGISHVAANIITRNISCYKTVEITKFTLFILGKCSVIVYRFKWSLIICILLALTRSPQSPIPITSLFLCPQQKQCYIMNFLLCVISFISFQFLFSYVCFLFLLLLS